MTTAPEMEKKVRQLDNDVHAIYTMIADIQNNQRRHTNRFNELTADVGGLERRMGSLETVLGSLETQLGSLETKLGSLETKVGSLETKVGSLEAKIDTVLELLQR